MPVLEETLQPQRLYWILHREVPPAAGDPAALGLILDHLAGCVSAARAKNTAYVREVVRSYAAVWLRAHPGFPIAERFQITDTLYRGKASPVLGAHGVAALCHELVSAPDPRFDTVRMLAYQFVAAAFSRTPRSELCLGAECRAAAAAATFRTVILKYAPECTFKTRGDFNVHGELMLNHLPAWMSCIMVVNEMPYPLAAKVYAAGVNKVVRPLLERAITDSVDLIAWGSLTFVVRDFVVMMSLVIEILASRAVHLLVNADVCRHAEKTWPLPYVWRTPGGGVEHGVRAGGVLHVFGSDVPACTACLQWLHMCGEAGSRECSDLYDLVLDTANVRERNPLKKFLL